MSDVCRKRGRSRSNNAPTLLPCDVEEDMKNPKAALAVVLGILSFVIFVQNTDVVTLRFLFWKLPVSQVILIPFIMLIGFVLGYIVGTTGKKR
jgi:uncharacterized integral membrane protein